jgi:hypothetical protein
VKILPCTALCNGQPALASRKPDTFHTVGTLSSPVYRYACRRCGRISTITSQEFSRLPRMSVDELLALNLISYEELNDPNSPNLDYIRDLTARDRQGGRR